jgi:serine/threonine protein kinase/Ca2+-binding EF-hand superfamily protein
MTTTQQATGGDALAATTCSNGAVASSPPSPVSATTTTATATASPSSPRRAGGCPRINQYELDIEIGRGGFGQVLLATDVSNGRRVAIKLVRKEALEKTDTLSYFLREAAMSQSITHPNIVKAIEFIDHLRVYALVLELAPNGELFDKIIDSKGKRFGERLARAYFQELCSAVAYLHGHGIVHRDLKAENLLVGERGELKVCDFGLARYTHDRANRESNDSDGHAVPAHDPTDELALLLSIAGSPDYVAPEILAPDGYRGCACDVWSIGVILYFMLCGSMPFVSNAKGDEARALEVQQKIARGDYNASNPSLSPSAADLIAHMLVVDPARRYTIKQVAEHPWVTTDMTAAMRDEIATCAAGGSVSQTARLAPDSASPMSTGARELLSVDPDVIGLINKAFHACNVGHTGTLTHDEVRDVLIKLNGGNGVSEDEVREFFACFALDGSSGSNGAAGGNGPAIGNEAREEAGVSEQRFIEGWSRFGPYLERKGVPIQKLAEVFHMDLESSLVGELRQAFAELDVARRGVVDVDALMAVPKLQLTREQAEQLLHILDADGSNSISFEEFVNAVTRSNLLTSHPIASRLQRLDSLFRIVEQQSAAHNMSSGFTVAGFREHILEKIRAESPLLRTTFADSSTGDSGNYLSGEVRSSEGKQTLLVAVRLQPTVPGFTRIVVYRIRGKTLPFHDWFRSFRNMLHDEICMMVESTAVVGESEWL